MVKSVTKLAEFNALIEKNPKVIVDCWASWCGPCKAIAPTYEELSGETDGVLFLKVESDEAEELSASLGITALPTFMFYHNGKKVSEFKGAAESKLREEIAALVAK